MRSKRASSTGCSFVANPNLLRPSAVGLCHVTRLDIRKVRALGILRLLGEGVRFGFKPKIAVGLPNPLKLRRHDLDNYLADSTLSVHIWTVLKTTSEILQDLAGRIKARRVALGWPQLEAAQRAGVAYRTWRRLETEGQASLEDMVKAAVALRCEDALSDIFPLPAASSLDALLAQQAASAARQPARVRAPRSRSAKAPRP